MKEFIEKLMDSKGFKDLSKIQKEVYPLAMAGKNVIGKSKTGSGKTHAFLFPIMEKIDTNNSKLQAIILAPTRELASQIYNNAIEFAKFNPELKVKLAAGGIDRKKNVESIKSDFQILVGTPGRVKDLALTTGNLNIGAVSMVVLDEIDMLFELNFMDDIDAIVSHCKKDAQMLVFSATIVEGLKPFLKKYMEGATIIDIDDDKTSSNVTHYALDCKERDKITYLVSLLDNINPYVCLIFSSKKTNVDMIYKKLTSLGKNVGIIHGDLESRERKQMMKRINNHEFEYIVASDIASRGIDVDSVTHVINFDLPKDREFYFHRAGRTGRMNNTGVCYTLYNQSDLNYLNELRSNGIDLINMEIKNGVLKEGKPFVREKRKKKVNPENAVYEEALNKGISQAYSRNRATKVKPGYKKKLKEDIAKVRKKVKKAQIKDMYKRKAKMEKIKASRGEM